MQLGVRVDRLGVAVVVLHRDFHGGLVDGFLVVEGDVLQDPAIAVVVAHKIGNSPSKK